jgi:hypothetical protein
VRDEQSGRNEARIALVSSATALAQGPPGAQPTRQFPAQSALVSVAERLVDRLVAYVPARSVGPHAAQIRGDLFRAPLQFQLGLDLCSQICVLQQATVAWAPSSLPRPGMGQVAVVDVPIVRKDVAAQLAADSAGSLKLSGVEASAASSGGGAAGA